MSYTTRVELHNASYSDYLDLHVAMASEGFSRLITSDDGVTYHLPTAEYNHSGGIDRSAALAKAKRAAATTGKKAAVLVTESMGRSWEGLEPVKK
jgi:hypothetical protein